MLLTWPLPWVICLHPRLCCCSLYGEQVTALLAMDATNSRNTIQVSGEALQLMPNPQDFVLSHKMDADIIGRRMDPGASIKMYALKNADDDEVSGAWLLYSSHMIPTSCCRLCVSVGACCCWQQMMATFMFGSAALAVLRHDGACCCLVVAARCMMSPALRSSSSSQVSGQQLLQQAGLAAAAALGLCQRRRHPRGSRRWS
jgi:hypothetical protein